MPLQETFGNLTTDAFGGGVAAVPNYIEDVFSTYLYTGNGATTNIINNIDLTNGGLVWTKNRTSTTYTDHVLMRTPNKFMFSNTTDAEYSVGGVISSYNTNGYTLGSSVRVNTSGTNYVGWTFKKQPKFFDIVTYTGTGSATTIAHNLGSTPGFVIVKRTDTADDWYCGITVFGGSDYLVLNSTASRATDSSVWNNTAPTSTVFTVGTNAGTNASGGTYVAYLFANNAGGFGLTGTDSVIKTVLVSSAGSGNTTYNLGWEPQFLMFKKTASTSDWFIYDTMRGMAYSAGAATLLADTAGAETTGISVVPTATGFVAALDNSFTYFCLAIRRGPMKVPTDATKVFAPLARRGNNATTAITSLGFAPDSVLSKVRSAAGYWTSWFDKLRGVNDYLNTTSTNAENTSYTDLVTAFGNTGFTLGADNNGVGVNVNNENMVYWNFQRAPSFFDEVVSAGTASSNQARTHNLGAIPELIFVKDRNSGGANWVVYSSTLGQNYYLNLNNTNNQQASSGAWGTSAFTSTTFYCNDPGSWSASVGDSGVFYLFASCPGVSKVGSYTGNGTTQTIDCGFTGGARFVLIKRTDSTGDWYVYDTARGMTTLTDPYLLLDTTAAEVATLGSVTTVSTGFALNAAILAAINTSSATYIFLAIA